MTQFQLLKIVDDAIGHYPRTTYIRPTNVKAQTLANHLRYQLRQIQHSTRHVPDDFIIGVTHDQRVYLGKRKYSMSAESSHPTTASSSSVVHGLKTTIQNPPESIIDAICYLHHEKLLDVPTQLFTDLPISHFESIYDIAITAVSPHHYSIQ